MPMSPRLLRPRAAGGFNPKSLPSLVGWWDASDSSTITLNGSTVSEWRDKSNSGFHVSQSTAANQPAYVSASLNGRAGIDWGTTAGTGIILRRNTMPAYAPRDKYIVADYDGTSPFPTFVGLMHDANVLSGSSGTTQAFLSSTQLKTHSFNGAATSFTMLPTVATPFVLRATYTSSGLPTTTTNQLGVGGWTSTTTRGWAGKIYEIIMLSEEASASVDASMKRYISAKWGIAVT
jgi:hypothetical protein